MVSLLNAISVLRLWPLIIGCWILVYLCSSGCWILVYLCSSLSTKKGGIGGGAKEDFLI